MPPAVDDAKTSKDDSKTYNEILVNFVETPISLARSMTVALVTPNKTPSSECT